MTLARRRLLVIVVGTTVFVAGLLTGLLAFNDDHPIEPVEIEQYYGVSSGIDSSGRYCISNQGWERCAQLRLPADSVVPEVGLPVRGGAAALPDDTSDLPTPVWLWVTKLQCDSTATDEDLAC